MNTRVPGGAAVAAALIVVMASLVNVGRKRFV